MVQYCFTREISCICVTRTKDTIRTRFTLHEAQYNESMERPCEMEALNCNCMLSICMLCVNLDSLNLVLPQVRTIS